MHIYLGSIYSDSLSLNRVHLALINKTNDIIDCFIVHAKAKHKDGHAELGTSHQSPWYSSPRETYSSQNMPPVASWMMPFGLVQMALQLLQRVIIAHAQVKIYAFAEKSYIVWVSLRYYITGDEGMPETDIALFGAVGPFIEGEEEWPRYIKRLEHFFGTNGVNDEGKKLAVLLS